MRLYNTLTRTVEEIRPIQDGLVTMYTCGPTVYRYAHLGNLRTFMLADLIRRGLELEGYRVTQIMNITDVGHMTDESSPEAVDKMLLAMEDEGLTPQEIAEKYTEAVFADAEALGIRPAGEGGTTPALGVVINAIVDALAELGVSHIEMPATPERVWRAIHRNGDSPAK
jgi:cysteinyl-tRNA synthetase